MQQDGGSAGGALPGECQACTMSADCTSGATCAQFQGDTFCAQACPNGDECGSSTTCTPETTFAGDQVSVCVPNDNACGTAPSSEQWPAGASDELRDAGPVHHLRGVARCAYLDGKLYVMHDVDRVEDLPAKRMLRRRGWWCDTSTNKCVSSPPRIAVRRPPGVGGAVPAMRVEGVPRS